jgi:hypothetical protein
MWKVQAESLWSEAARAVGRTLRVVDAEGDAGGRVMVAADVAAVPCLVAARDRVCYGIHHSPAEAEAFLQESLP